MTEKRLKIFHLPEKEIEVLTDLQENIYLCLVTSLTQKLIQYRPF